MSATMGARMEAQEARRRACQLVQPERRVGIGQRQQQCKRRGAHRQAGLELHRQVDHPAGLAQRRQRGAEHRLRIAARLDESRGRHVRGLHRLSHGRAPWS
jgi:hypothetical protein